MDHKLKGDISEHKAITKLLELEYPVLKPIGDRLRYDLVIETDKRTFLKLQVKTAYKTPSNKTENYEVSIRRTCSNRKITKYYNYTEKDFDFVLIYTPQKDTFHILPVYLACQYSNTITLSKKLDLYKNNWELLKQINI